MKQVGFSGRAKSSPNPSELSGRLRDYRAFEGLVNPYRTPNFLFLGDDTGSVRAKIKLAHVALELAASSR